MSRIVLGRSLELPRDRFDTHSTAVVRTLGMPTTKKKSPSKRELIEPHKGDRRYVRRKPDGTFGKTVDVGRSLSADNRSTAKTKVPKGQGDRGDTKR